METMFQEEKKVGGRERERKGEEGRGGEGSEGEGGRRRETTETEGETRIVHFVLGSFFHSRITVKPLFSFCSPPNDPLLGV